MRNSGLKMTDFQPGSPNFPQFLEGELSVLVYKGIDC